uniref:ATP synthase F0 subunit 6 n=1 Tax=Cyathocotyle prussica TaxID=2067575 RepID=A0A6J3YMF1_9TREM|nr:ATP synthase F0 subunit 6 [Cyathocotyle prussica]AYH51386.1 ATP synthase F0 subunit 6 [Cyathocotyle prussica]
MFLTRLSLLGGNMVSSVIEGVNDRLYYCILIGMLFCFLLLRIPYIFGIGGFSMFLVLVIMPLFLAMMLSRLSAGASLFFSSFIPMGTPLWIAPFVCLAETISYIVRPVVLVIRPFINLSIGAMAGMTLGVLCWSMSWGVFCGLLVLFFYEVFVALVHWYIVCSILAFSADH